MDSSYSWVKVRTISVQVEGSVRPVHDVIVDKVGFYAFQANTVQEEVLQLVMNVELHGRTKLLTVHSPVRLVNGFAKMQLEFKLYVDSQRGANNGTVEMQYT